MLYSNEIVCTDCIAKQTLIDTLNDANQRLETDFRRIEKELDLKSQKIIELELALERSESAHKIEIADLKLKMQQSNSNRDNECSDDESDCQYEVECLLKHKVRGGEQFFFVKWKNYDNRHNSWVKRSNLCCKEILQSYLKANRMT